MQLHLVRKYLLFAVFSLPIVVGNPMLGYAYFTIAYDSDLDIVQLLAPNEKYHHDASVVNVAAADIPDRFVAVAPQVHTAAVRLENESSSQPKISRINSRGPPSFASTG